MIETKLDRWRDRSEALFLGLSVVLFVSLFYSRFALSLSLFGLFFLALLNSGSKIFSSFWNHRWKFAFVLVWLSILLSGINSSDLGNWVKHLQLKLPFLVLPLAFASFRFLKKELIYKIIYLFIGICFITAIHVSVLYFSNFEEYNMLILHGQSLPTPIHHVTYSVLISFATVAGIILYLEDSFYPQFRIPVMLISIFFFVFIHVLAVRTGLVSMYLALLVLIFKRLIQTKNYLQGIGCLALCFLAPVLAFYFVPSFFNKIGYMVWDFTEMMRNKTVNYSDGGRLLSFQLGWELLQSNPLLGTGIGDFEQSSEAWYQSNVNGYEGKLNYPHNQFLFSAASTGIIGMLIYQLGIWIPFFASKMYRNSFGISLFVILLATFMVETQLELSNGIIFFLYFACLLISIQSSKNSVES